MTPKEVRQEITSKAKELESFKQSENNLKTIVDSYQDKIYSFCLFFLPAEEAEEVVFDVFHQFSYEFKRQYLDKARTTSEDLVRTLIFKNCWQAIQSELLRNSYAFQFGRDTRPLQNFETQVRENDVETIRERLSVVDPDLRVVLLLKDHFKLNDEEISQILNLRWGVYRHRLHRARLDFVASIKGTLFQWN